MFRSTPLTSLSLASVALAQTYSQTFTPDSAPKTSRPTQTGTNQCGSFSSQNSMCQNAYVNSIQDFCLFAPHEPGPMTQIGSMERTVVAWCLRPGYGTRIIPQGTITGAHFVQTPDYVQVTGIGDLTKLNIPKGDTTTTLELDPHGEDGLGNPIGGLVFSSAFGDGMTQMHEWTNFVAEGEFCIRACKDGPAAAALCQHIYDLMDCRWNMPGSYKAGFDTCKGENGEPVGIDDDDGSVFQQGDPVTPSAHPTPSTSQCTTVSTVGGALPAPTAPVPLRWQPTSEPDSIQRTSPTRRPDTQTSPAGNGAKAPRRPYVREVLLAIAGAGAALAIMRI
ncbi:hypothetical protein V8D89_002720 [Ganoderma adspersum]